MKKYYENETFTNLHLFEEAIDAYEFVDCKFVDCVFEECTVYYCRFAECDFINCQITEIKNKGSEIIFLSFDNCCMVGMNWGMFALMDSFKVPIQEVTVSALKYNIFAGMNFSKFVFDGTDIISSTFSECKLTESSFNGCNLTDTEFFKCDVCKADFRNATGYKVDVLSCKMKGARFSYPEVQNLLSSLDIKIEAEKIEL